MTPPENSEQQPDIVDTPPEARQFSPLVREEGPEHPSPEWFAREATNYGRTLEGPLEQVTNPQFVARLTQQSLANVATYSARSASDPSWLLGGITGLLEGILGGLSDPESLSGLVEEQLLGTLQGIPEDPTSALALLGNAPVLPLCATWGAQCAGDPFRYPGVDRFYSEVGEITPVVFYDRDCARLTGRVWRPSGLPEGTTLPNVVIQNGSVQAPETLYWWMAQLLVENGYAVMTFDPRGQGRADLQTPQGVQGSNFNPVVFWEGFVDAIDFFRSTPDQPYPHNDTCAGTTPTPVTAFNPYFAQLDPDRLGIAGHSLGAVGASIVQGMGGVGADPWDGVIDVDNPVKVALGWDGAIAPSGPQLDDDENGPRSASSPIGLLFSLVGADAPRPQFVPRVPMMMQDSDYGITPVPFFEPPNPRGQLQPFDAWKAAGADSFSFTIRGSSHFEWSLLPTFPTTSWCPEIMDGRCQGGWGLPMAEHYSLAWLDRYLKLAGEPGFEDADDRLLDDETWRERFSFYYDADREFVTRDGTRVTN